MSVSSEFLSKLSSVQQKAACDLYGPCLIYAGAGSGKTRTLIGRILCLLDSGVLPERIVCITFTNKAADEILERLQLELHQDISSKLNVSTFHSFCAKLLRIHGKHIGIPNNYTIYDRRDSLVAINEALSDYDNEYKVTPNNLLDSISNLKSGLESPIGFIDSVEDTPINRFIYTIYVDYTALLNDYNAIDFDDLLVKGWQLFTSTTPLLNDIQHSYDFLLIDEYQDTNYAQSMLAEAIIKYTGNLCAIGDPRQSVYGFRGADYKIIMDFESTHPGASKHILNENYRSTQTIVGASESLIKNNTLRPDYICNSTRCKGNNIKIVNHYNGEEEALSIVKDIEDKHAKGMDYSKFAILYRVNMLSRMFEHALSLYRIPYTIVGDVGYWARQEVKDVIAYLKLALNTEDDVAFQRVVNSPRRGVGNVTIKKLRGLQLDKSMYDTLQYPLPGLSKVSSNGLKEFSIHVKNIQKLIAANSSVRDIIRYIIIDTKLLLHYEKTNEANKVDNLKELVASATDFDKMFPGDVCRFLETAVLSNSRSGNTSSDNVVSIMSLHQCKGLEFLFVYIAGIEEGILPHARAYLSGDIEEIEEERRLLYVGMTRAIDELSLHCVRFRGLMSNNSLHLPSRESEFLLEIDEQYISRV